MYDLYYIIAGANHNLSNANNKNLDIGEYEVSNGASEVLRTFLRCEYLKNCILSYNSVEDYILQIVTFGLGIIIYNYKKNKLYTYSKTKKEIFSNEDLKLEHMIQIKYKSIIDSKNNFYKSYSNIINKRIDSISKLQIKEVDDIQILLNDILK